MMLLSGRLTRSAMCACLFTDNRCLSKANSNRTILLFHRILTTTSHFLAIFNELYLLVHLVRHTVKLVESL